MKLALDDIIKMKSKWVTVYGLPSELNWKDGTRVKIIWINETHVEIMSGADERLCLRTYIAEDVLYYNEEN